MSKAWQYVRLFSQDTDKGCYFYPFFAQEYFQCSFILLLLPVLEVGSNSLFQLLVKRTGVKLAPTVLVQRNGPPLPGLGM